jgi:hypothetical protein
MLKLSLSLLLIRIRIRHQATNMHQSNTNMPRFISSANIVPSSSPTDKPLLLPIKVTHEGYPRRLPTRLPTKVTHEGNLGIVGDVVWNNLSRGLADMDAPVAGSRE